MASRGRTAYAESAPSTSISISTSLNSESRSSSPTHEQQHQQQQQQIEAFIIPRLKFVHRTLQALLTITAHPFRDSEWELTKSLLIYQIQCLQELVTDYGDEYAAALARVHSVFLQRGIELQEDHSPSWSRSARAYRSAMYDAAENLVQCALDTRGETAAESALDLVEKLFSPLAELQEEVDAEQMPPVPQPRAETFSSSRPWPFLRGCAHPPHISAAPCPTTYAYPSTCCSLASSRSPSLSDRLRLSDALRTLDLGGPLGRRRGGTSNRQDERCGTGGE